jgi:hypothetical protein
MASVAPDVLDVRVARQPAHAPSAQKPSSAQAKPGKPATSNKAPPSDGPMVVPPV